MYCSTFNIKYVFIMRKAFSVEERRNFLQSLCELFAVEGIDKAKILEALADDSFSDFEDCLQMECAIAFRARLYCDKKL